MQEHVEQCKGKKREAWMIYHERVVAPNRPGGRRNSSNGDSHAHSPVQSAASAEGGTNNSVAGQGTASIAWLEIGAEATTPLITSDESDQVVVYGGNLYRCQCGILKSCCAITCVDCVSRFDGRGRPLLKCQDQQPMYNIDNKEARRIASGGKHRCQTCGKRIVERLVPSCSSAGAGEGAGLALEDVGRGLTLGRRVLPAVRKAAHRSRDQQRGVERKGAGSGQTKAARRGERKGGVETASAREGVEQRVAGAIAR